MTGGRFISLEGGEGAGKSTQATRLARYLEARKIEVVLTREVGGSPSGEAIRKLWLDQNEGYWDPLSELLLVSAARREHLVKLIWPALQRGAWVISDRFADSSAVYQGVGLALGIETTDNFYRHIAGGFEPDLTLLLDLPVDQGAARVTARRGTDDRYQRRDLTFHQKLRDAYLDLAAMHRERFRIIDAGRDTDQVTEDVQKAVAALLVS